MNAYIAKQLGYSNIVNITYCQSGSQDEKIAKKLSSQWLNEHLIMFLDSAQCLYDVDNLVEMNGGLNFYCAITGGKSLLEKLNSDLFGLEHTGILGGAILGSYLHTENDNKLTGFDLDGMYSRKLSSFLSKRNLEQYANKELYLMNVRGFHGTICSSFIRQNFTEMISPFLDVDFLEFCFSIPLKNRLWHKIYLRWITAKYPQVASVAWNGVRITNIGIATKLLMVSNYIKAKFLRMLGSSKYSMNPHDYWYKHNSNLREFIDNYYDLYKSNLCFIQPEYRTAIERLFEQGNCLEKCQVLTILSAISYYNGKRDS